MAIESAGYPPLIEIRPAILLTLATTPVRRVVGAMFNLRARRAIARLETVNDAVKQFEGAWRPLRFALTYDESMCRAERYALMSEYRQGRRELGRQQRAATESVWRTCNAAAEWTKR